MDVDRAFIDTNIFIYLYSASEQAKREQCEQLVDEYDRFVSTQVLNEFCNVAIKKLAMPASAVRDAVSEICEGCNLILVDDDTVQKALDFCEKYKYSDYDSLILASAIESDCRYIISEDLQAGQLIDGKLTIVSPFS